MTDRARISRLLAIFNELTPGYKDLILNVVQGVQSLRQNTSVQPGILKNLDTLSNEGTDSEFPVSKHEK